MEANICCAYNLSRDCKVSAKVTAADCGNEPFKLMKLMLDGLAKDPERGFWLTRLTHSPQIVRLFPFDFVYLDSELRIVQAVELPAEAMLPRFHAEAASALILPLHSLSASGTAEGDRLIICPEKDLETQIAEAAPEPLIEEAPVAALAAVSIETPEPRTASAPVRGPVLTPAPTIPFASPSLPISIPAAVAQGAGYTVALTSGWQISNSTTAGALLEPVDAEEAEDSRESLPIAERATTEEEPVLTAEEQVSDAEAPGTDAILLKPVTPEEPAVAAEVESPPVASNSIVEVDPELIAALDAGTGSAVDGDSGIEKMQAREERAAGENLAILDTDLAGIFDAELPEEFTEVDGLEGLETVTAEIDVASPSEQPVAGDGPLGDKALPAQDSTVAAQASQVEQPPAANKTAETEPRQDLARKTGPARSVTAEPKKAEQPERGTRERVAASSPAGKPGASKTQIPDAARAKPPRQAGKRSFGFLVKEFLNCPDPLPELRTHARLVQQGMVAFEKSVNGASPMEIRDLSPTGFYLRTKKRWQPGKVVALTLQKSDAREDEYQSFVDIRAKVVRSDENGIGLSWILPEGVQFDPWKRLHTKRSDESDIQFFLRELRLARAEGFLQRICPTATDQIKHALHERLSNKRVASAVEIALKAENLLPRSGSLGQRLAHSEVVTRVIENGSWIEDGWIRKMWAGLLVSSCTADGSDRSSLPFLDLLARLTPIHLRIFAFACERAVKAIADGASEATLDLYSTAEELMEAADSHSFQRVQQTVGHLCNFGLLKEAARPSYAAIDDKVQTRTTPSALGLKMYAFCNGQR